MHGHGLSAAPQRLDTLSSFWRISRQDEGRVAALARQANVPGVVASLLIARGVTTAEEVSRFFRPETSSLHDPFGLKGAEEATDILARAARSGRRIVVFGDYDVDGVTAVAQLRAALLRAGADAVAFLPHRLRDGYGLKPETARRVLSDLSPAVLVTVDCGITAVEGVACARAQGVEVVVTDHHLVPEQLPRGAVVVNPKQPGCGYPYKELSASGIAMKLSEAVARRASVRLSRESLLRAACLGTIADLVPLTGENRAIAAAGLAALASPRAPGLKALLAESGVPEGRPPTSEEVAFRIAPRLNAAGRLDSAELALSLFEERDPARARSVARQLTLQNALRQSIERRVAAEARERLARDFDPERDAVIIEADAGWHRGVLGIAASRLAREYYRPVLLFGLERERASGSGRSIPGVSLYETLRPIAHLFDEFGGHDQAVGGSLPASRFPQFREAARALFAQRIPREHLLRVEEAEAELPIEEVSDRLLGVLERFEPHGMGNPRPVFASPSVCPAAPFRSLGDSGARGRLRRDQGELDCVCWRRETAERLASSAGALQIHYRITRGLAGAPEVEILAARPPSSDAALTRAVRQSPQGEGP